jgi:MFS family permease
MRSFKLIWLGQLVSLLGSSLTTFALSVWVYQETGSVTDYTIVQLCGLLPPIILSALAGGMRDRFTWRQLMIVADAGGLMGVIALVGLASLGFLRLWQLCICIAVSSSLTALRAPSYSAAIAQLLVKEQLGRANGMVGLAQAMTRVFAPSLAGVLLVPLGLQGILLMNGIAYGAALATLALIPPVAPQPDTSRQESFKARLAGSVHYVLARKGLAALLVYYAALNFIMGMVTVLVMPLVLSIGTPTTLGMVLSAGGLGMLTGSLLMSAWGGPRRRIHGALGFMLIAAVSLVIGGSVPSVPLLAVAAFGFFFAFPIAGGCNESIWQTKVDSAMRVRVFALAAASKGTLPLGFLAAGPLADRVFEPLMAPHGLLASSAGSWIGVGHGRGAALLIMANGCLIALIVALGYSSPRVRLVEDELPDAPPAPAGPPVSLEPLPSDAR